LTHTGSFARRPWSAGKWRELALAAFLTVYFLVFNWGSLRVHFALDDLGNIDHYYEYSPWQMVLSNFLPWRGDYRPLGGLFYIPIYHFAGLNPVPYQAVLLAIVLANVYFAYRLVRLLGGGELAAGLVALVCCYHGGVANLYYNAAFVYDAMCCCLYLAALAYYVRIRNRGQLPGAWQTVVFLLLFLAALDAKEMAVSVPVMVLVYEWIYHRPEKWSRASLLAWVRGPARVSLIAAALTLVDIYPKVAGSTAMVTAEGYRPVFTLERVRAFQVALYQDLFFSWNWTPGWVQIVWPYLLLAYLAWRRADRPILRFLFWYLLVVPLPIEFLPGKREACFALLMVGGAAFAAVVFADAVEAAARFLARGFRLPPAGRPLLAGVMVAAAVLVWVREQRYLREMIGGAPMTTLGSEDWDIIQQMRASSFHPRPGSSVAFLDDPYHDLDMYHQARLWFHDRTITIHGSSQGPLTQQELAKMDYVFTFENRKLIRIR
jgi:hypothetical protein